MGNILNVLFSQIERNPQAAGKILATIISVSADSGPLLERLVKSGLELAAVKMEAAVQAAKAGQAAGS